jgi:hypothetical protein
MGGAIKSRQVLMHGVAIVRLFGPRCYLRCLRAVFSSKPTTFLETVFGQASARDA